jgi:hypothetical protein
MNKVTWAKHLQSRFKLNPVQERKINKRELTRRVKLDDSHFI